MESIDIAHLCAKYADEKKAEDIVLLDLRGLSPVTDYFVICTANSNPQMRAIRDEIVTQMRDQHSQKPLFAEGGFESQWQIVNYPNVMVHIFTRDKREFYALEELWGDAPRIALSDAAAAVEEQKAAVRAAKKAARKSARTKKAAPRKTATKRTAAKTARKSATKKAK